jgi:AraC-like DNA-binding protein
MRNLPVGSSYHGVLTFEGLVVIKNCVSVAEVQNQTYLDSHLVLLVLRGSFALKMGTYQAEVRENEIILVPKNTAVQYRKHGDQGPNSQLEYWMFFITDDLLAEFAGKVPHVVLTTAKLLPEPKPANQRLIQYLESLRPYFFEPEAMDAQLVRLKILELLFNLAAVDRGLLGPLFDRQPPSRKTFADLMEQNIFTGMSLEELAALTGRSLSSFKRDFSAIYHTAPAHWFREQKIVKAMSLLEGTNLSVTDICFRVGFESLAHFSRVFRQSTGQTPLRFRQQFFGPEPNRQEL